MRARVTSLVAAVVACGSLIAACSSAQGDLLPPPSSTSTTAATTTTTGPDFSRVALERLPGETTLPPLEADGRTTIRGSVSGPDGPVADAVVRIERLVGDRVQQFEVRTNGSGAFSRGSLPGGRFRVRAFREPAYTTMEPRVFFVADGDTREVGFTLGRYDQVFALAATTPPNPMAGQGVNLAVRVARQFVDGDGVVQEAPLPGERVRISSSGWTLLGAEAAVTGVDGVAVFEYRCDRAGPVTATAVLGAPAPAPDGPDDPAGDGGETTTTTLPDEEAGDPGGRRSIALDVPDCAPRPAPATTTTTTTTPDDADGGADDGPDTTG